MVAEGTKIEMRNLSCNTTGVDGGFLFDVTLCFEDGMSTKEVAQDFKEFLTELGKDGE